MLRLFILTSYSLQTHTLRTLSSFKSNSLVGDGSIDRLPLQALFHFADGSALAVLWFLFHRASIDKRRVMPVYLQIAEKREVCRLLPHAFSICEIYMSCGSRAKYMPRAYPQP